MVYTYIMGTNVAQLYYFNFFNQNHLTVHGIGLLKTNINFTPISNESK